jgi:hypothetical protein
MLHKNGFTHPYSSPAMSPSTDCAAFQGGPLNLNSSAQSHLPLKKRKGEVPDDVMDELGHILEPWRILTSPLVTGVENLPNPGAVVFSVVFQLSSSASPNTLFILGWVSLFLWFQVQSDFCYCNHLFGCLCQPDVTVFDAVSIMLNAV